MRQKLLSFALSAGLMTASVGSAFAQQEGGGTGQGGGATQTTQTTAQGGQSCATQWSQLGAEGTGPPVVMTGGMQSDQEMAGFSAVGTIVNVFGNQCATFLTSAISGTEEMVVLDLSQLAAAEGGFEVQEQTAIHVALIPQENGTFLAQRFEGMAQGDMVNNTDFGIQEEWTTRDDSINARVENVPDDDEALAQNDPEDDDEDDEDEEDEEQDGDGGDGDGDS
jgi:hypothetical protein